jgi:peptidoglycan/LPS O-acetylase OafA/YrhL/lysophospholipase L1-like esterase
VTTTHRDAGESAPVALGGSRARFPHVPALDGLRGAAVLAVLLYHGAFLDRTWLSGGYLGVDLFFVLSGYLITSLLLVEFNNDGGVDLLAFWGRRLRRLLPALLLLLVGVAVYAEVVARPVDLTQIRQDGFGTLFYVANWVSIFRGQSYWDISLVPSPLQHTWSLAIEEQFYLVWPVVVWFLARGCRSARDRGVLLAQRVQYLAVGGAIVSVVLFTGLWSAGASATRVYQGTDTRAFALLMGVALAATRFLRPDGRRARSGRRVKGRPWSAMEVAGLLAVGLLAWAWYSLEGTSPALYQGLLPACSFLGAVVIAAASAPGSPVVAPVLSFAPLRWFGLISYGLYLWHWPLYLVLTPDRTGLSGLALLVVRIAASVSVAVISFVLVEQPIRLRRWTLARPVPSIALAMAVVAGMVLIASNGAEELDGGLDASGPRRSSTEVAGAPSAVYIGDSVAYSLGQAVVSDPAAYQVNPVNLASVGCEFAVDGRVVRFPDGGTRPAKPCRDAMLAATVDEDPDVVVLAVGSPFLQETIDVDGTFRDPCQQEYRNVMRELYEDLASKVTADGAVLLVGTIVPRTLMAPTNERERVGCFNDVVRAVAEEDPAVEVLDLAGFVCPDGVCRGEVDGERIRPDGLHFTGPGGQTVSAWVAEQVRVAAGAS